MTTSTDAGGRDGDGEPLKPGGGPTIVDKQYKAWSALAYGAVILMIVITLVARARGDELDPEKIFTATIFIGTLLGGIGTVYSLARAITTDGWSKDVFILVMQTLGVWVGCVGTLASATLR